jgi:hypothetical protein
MGNNIRDAYKSLPEADLHRIRLLIRQGAPLAEIADRAGVALAVIGHAAARVRRSDRRLKKRLASSSPFSPDDVSGAADGAAVGDAATVPSAASSSTNTDTAA